MSIDAISALSAGSSLSAMSGLSALTGLSAAGGAQATTASSATRPIVDTFATTIAGQIDTVQAAQSTATELAVKAVTGDLDDIHDYTVASSQASVMLELTAALRNKAVDAFAEIMRMQA